MWQQFRHHLGISFIVQGHLVHLCYLSMIDLCKTVKPVLRDHCHERPPVLKDHTFLGGHTFQYNWTCHQRPPVLIDHIFKANGVVFQDRFHCTRICHAEQCTYCCYHGCQAEPQGPLGCFNIRRTMLYACNFVNVEPKQGTMNLIGLYNHFFLKYHIRI